MVVVVLVYKRNPSSVIKNSFQTLILMIADRAFPCYRRIIIFCCHFRFHCVNTGCIGNQKYTVFKQTLDSVSIIFLNIEFTKVNHFSFSDKDSLCCICCIILTLRMSIISLGEFVGCVISPCWVWSGQPGSSFAMPLASGDSG